MQVSDPTTRRRFLAITAAAAAASTPALVLPIHHVLDTATKPSKEDLRRFNSAIWPETVRDFARCGIQFLRTEGTGEVRRTPAGNPTFSGLAPRAINLVLTPFIPRNWDRGRALSGLSTIYERHHICVIALLYAHTHQIPFLSVNTCVHELLHVLMLDIFDQQSKGISAGVRELRIDAYATRLWLFHDGDAIRKSAQIYAERLKKAPA